MMARLLLTALLTLVLAACAGGRVVTETETILQPVPAWKPIPSEYTEPLTIPSVPPTPLTVEDLIELVEQLMTLVEQAQADRAHLRALQPAGEDNGG
jgi:hypothetical protein